MLRSRARRALLVFALLSTACAHPPAHQPAPGTPARIAAPAALPAEQFHAVELHYELTEPLRARFTSERGATLERISFPQRGGQTIRFAPPAPGSWRFEVRTEGPAHPSRTVASGRIQARPTHDPGYLHARGHHLEFEDGQPFLAIGENRINIYDPSWNYEHLPPEQYVRYMAENGMTTLRMFIRTDVEDEEHGGRLNPGVLEPRLGEFDEHVAEQLDGIFRAAEERGVYVVLVAFALGFSENDPWKSWEDNPYSAARGGPAKTRYDFFEPGPARALAARRLRYLAARWGASTHLLAIDLLNEPEWDGAIPEVSWIPWAEEMARAWRAADPYGHLVTVGSVGLQWNIEGDERPWYASPEDDLVEWHLYGKEVYEVHALAAELTRKTRETWGYGKPVLVGEFAWGGEPKPAYDHTHVGLWVSVFSGAGVLAHSAPPFNVDSDEWMTPARAHHFLVLRRFFTGMPALDPIAARASGGARAWALAGNGSAAVWVLAPEPGYGEEVTGAQVSLTVSAGRWRLQWFDDVSGGEVGAATDLIVPGGAVELAVPPFRRHLAAKLIRVAPPELQGREQPYTFGPTGAGRVLAQ